MSCQIHGLHALPAAAPATVGARAATERTLAPLTAITSPTAVVTTPTAFTASCRGAAGGLFLRVLVGLAAEVIHGEAP